MIKTSLIKKCSLVFSILCLIGLVLCLAFAITLPKAQYYNTIYGTMKLHSAGSFDMSFLSPVILFAFGFFWGIVTFAAIPGKKKEKTTADDKKTEPEAVLEQPAEAPAEEV